MKPRRAESMVQFKISGAQRASIANGRIVMDFDPAVFGDIVSAAIFSAAGDTYGYVRVTDGHHLDALFTSPMASVGKVTGLPLMEIILPVLRDAEASSAIT